MRRLAWVWLLVIAGVVLVAGAVVRAPLVATGALLLMVAGSHGLFFAHRLQRAWLVTFAVILAGYVLLDKGFAYLITPPVFVGEIALVLGLWAVVMTGGITLALRSPISWLLIAFIVHGAARTLPYIPVYGLNALRDAAIWVYAVFALLVAAFLLRSRWLEWVPEGYARLLPWFLAWLPVAAAIQTVAAGLVPRVPGTEVPMLYLKANDVAVHLAGAAVFLLLGLRQFHGRSRRPGGRGEWLWWSLWLLGALWAVSVSRGALLAILAAITVALALHPPSISRAGKLVLSCAIVGAFLVAGNVQIDLGLESGRKIAPQQIVSNLRSVATGEAGSYSNLAGTREWRLDWWGDIVGYTFLGEYFWTGKGYGINLADDDGYQVTANGSLRSPHNGHLTILARGGVPGLVLWALLQGAFGIAMFWAYLRARRDGLHRWVRFNVWILAYWVAFLTSAAFDVYLEGPQAGIWFWSVFGFGIAALEAQRIEARQRTAATTRSARARQPLATEVYV